MKKKTFTTWLMATSVAAAAMTPSGPVSASPELAKTSEALFSDWGQIDSSLQEAVIQASELGLISGDPSGKFRPLDTLTRQELAVLLARFLHIDPVNTKYSSFHDVAVIAWAHPYIEAVKAAGIMQGDGKSFRPGERVTREELAAALMKSIRQDKTAVAADSATFADRSQVSAWAGQAVQDALTLGMMELKDGHFAPKQAVQRQEAAASLVHAFHEQTAVLDWTDGQRISIGGKTYLIGDSLKGLLRIENNPILKGAKIRFAAAGSTLNRIDYLEIVQSGENPAAGEAEFSRNIVLDAQGDRIEGSVVISGDFVTVKHLTVAGDFEISRALYHDFYGYDVTVSGKTVINGGDTNTVVFENAKLQTVDINKKDVRVDASGTTTVKEFQIYSSTTLIGEKGSTIERVTLKDGAENVDISASIDSLIVSSGASVNLATGSRIQRIEVTDRAAQLKIQPGANVDDIKLPTNVDISAIVSNYEQVRSQIGNVNGTKPASPTVQLPPASSQTPTPNPSTPQDPTPNPDPTTPQDPTPNPDPTTPQDPTPNPDPTTPQDPTPNPDTTTPQDPTPNPDPTTPQDPTPNPDTTTPQDPTPNPGPTTPQDPTPNPDPTTPQDPTPNPDPTTPQDPTPNPDPTTPQDPTPNPDTTTPNHAPTVANPISDMTVQDGQPADDLDLSAVFADEDGDALTLSAVSSNENAATVSVTQDNKLQIAPVGGGSALITVTANDGKGGTQTATFTLTVNRAPYTVNAVADQNARVGEGDVTVGLSGIFADDDGDQLDVSPVSENPGVAEVRKSDDGSQLIITPVAAGSVKIVLTAADPTGREVKDEFMVSVAPAYAKTPFFSEVDWGSDWNQYFEIYNPTGSPIDLDRISIEWGNTGRMSLSDADAGVSGVNNLPAGDAIIISDMLSGDLQNPQLQYGFDIASEYSDSIVVKLIVDDVVVDSIVFKPNVSAFRQSGTLAGSEIYDPSKWSEQSYDSSLQDLGTYTNN
ncbi:S-layer homology domain-containing protein [Paenibacillus aurantiacus]|uniref:S-layer homology domain-containing protein n=1 Tax=Paenibacillus aurantiacus TaxID=1936118 RepID=A0ABV5L3A6_9BACL